MSKAKARLIAKILAFLSLYIDNESSLEVYDAYIKRRWKNRRWEEKMAPELEQLTWELFERVRPDNEDFICCGKPSQCDYCGYYGYSRCVQINKGE